MEEKALNEMPTPPETPPRVVLHPPPFSSSLNFLFSVRKKGGKAFRTQTNLQRNKLTVDIQIHYSFPGWYQIAWSSWEQVETDTHYANA